MSGAPGPAAAGSETKDDHERPAIDHGRHVDGSQLPDFCPGCAYPVGEDLHSIAVEFWESERPIYRLHCASCGWTGDIAPMASGDGES